MNLLSVVFAVGLCATASPQEPVPAVAPALPAAALAWPPGLVLTDRDADTEAIRVAGANWKAVFTAAGAEFTPFLGSEVPSQPARFRLRSVRVAGGALAVDGGHPRQRGQRVSYQRGSCAETYDLLADGIEQQFAFAALPARGELVLDIAVATALAAERDGAGLAFRGPHGGIAYGAAVAIDAAGRRCGLTSEWSGDGIRLTVPAEFVAAAALPLVVDPMVGVATSLANSSVVLSSSDVVHDASRGQFAVCYERAFSATDHDVFVALLDANMVFSGLLTIDASADYWSKPRMAGLEGPDQLCVAAEFSVDGVAPFTVAWRRVQLGSPAIVQPVSMLPFTPTVDLLQPVVGGDPDPAASSTFLLACIHRNNLASLADVRAWNVNDQGLTWFAQFLLLNAANVGGLSISKTCGDRAGGAASWALVFRSQQGGSLSNSLRAAIVDQQGPTLRTFGGNRWFGLGSAVLSGGATQVVSSPTDAAHGRRFLCVERPALLLGGDHPLVGHLFDHAGTVLQQGVTLASSPGMDHRGPAVDCDGIRFAVVASAHLSATDADVYCRTFGIVGSALVQQGLAAVSYSGDYDAEASVAAMRGMPHGEFVVGLVRSDGSGHELLAQRFFGLGFGGIATRATSCGNLGTSMTGLPWIGEAVTATLSASSGLCGYVVGLPSASPIGPCPGCTLGADGTPVFGQAFTFAIPGNAAFVGLTVSLQGFRFVASGAPCLGQIELSDTHDVTIR